ncbi:MAG: hypothetical protein K0Q70_2044 [Rhodospirillales bacterium]|jgi:hypothetical protein|nr:hypothetical protein [Rhodospirillales bacterium]
MKLMNACLVAACALSLAGCQTTARDEYGKSPLSITSGLRDAINEYLEAGEPKYFAVSEDGRAYGYSSCHSTRCKIEEDFFLAQSVCLRMSAGVPCKIYARGTAVVWEPSAVTLIASPPAPRTVHVPEDGLQHPGRRWNGGRIKD